MRVLIACEFSGTVREAFAARGHDAWSCDLQPTETPGHHIQGDVRAVLCGCVAGPWDLMIAHPPCRFLAASGARWWPGREAEQRAAVEFVKELAAAPIPRIAIENPRGALTRLWRGADQYVQPWWFGDAETKATGLWLWNLWPLIHTEPVKPTSSRTMAVRSNQHRARNRSRTPPGLARAMAEQWGRE